MNLLTIGDLTKTDIDRLIERAIYLKERHLRGIPHMPLKGKTLALVFEKPSTRTRVSFECAMRQLGGDTLFISASDSQLGRSEPIKDTARVMSGYVSAVAVRTFGHERIEEFADYSTIPVINGLTDLHHPCQVLSDIMTVVEKKGGYEGLKISWIGDGNNMANSWIEAASILGFHLFLACPEGYLPNPMVMEKAKKTGKGNIEISNSVDSSARDADVLNTDVWASMGQEEERERRIKAFKGYQINSKVLNLAKKDAVVMHCLPAHRGEEITEEALEGAHSVVWEESWNRLHMQKAILERLVASEMI